ncbi:MAG: SMP-30/gluconolactonase/LRE family protein [Bryobacterales bacterium]|nr:SMP-30/gluconolactonase/LRE family protein [Bryobacterales bacterium]
MFAQDYALGPDSQRRPGVPEGKVTQHTFASSKVFPGTTRDYWIYVPAQYSPGKPAAVMVFQDGAGAVNVTEKGQQRVPIVLDNLIHRGEMPVTIGIFINPGVLPGNAGAPIRYNRSFEYDSLGDRYARFLIDEILPEAAKQYNLSKDPNDYAIGGVSSGAICAFTVAWNRPDVFRRVLSFIGSYTNLKGGNVYPDLIRKTEPKPIRIFLQDGDKDLNIYSGSWWMANQSMAWALEYAGYDFKFVKGTEAHNMRHGGAILPEALKWLWRDYPKPVERSWKGGERHYATEITEPGKGWELVSSGYRFTEGPAVNKAGEVFFTDIPNNRIHKIGLDGQVTVWRENTSGANGLMFGPDGRLYACQNNSRRIVAWTMDGAETVLAEDVGSNDIAVTAKGEIYFTEPQARRVWFINARQEKRVVHEGLEFPNGVRLSADHSLLLVVDSRNKWVWSFQIQPDGSLANAQPFYRLETTDENSQSGGDGMTVDSEGYLYVTTRVGVQVCDQPGRVVAILNKPWNGALSNAVFGGPNLDTLYVTAGDKVYKRAMRRKGIYPWEPAKLPAPRL